LPILIIPFIIGLLDDLISLKPLAKLIAQAITASLLFFILDIRLSSTYGLFGHISFAAPVSFLITMLTVVVITNSLNLIDGIDGLAATFAFVACLFFGSWFLFTHNFPLSIVCFALAGGILAFLFQNWEPSNIFMGDTGSLVIGTTLSVLTIQFINQNYLLPPDDNLKFTSSIGTAICALIIPLTDTSRIIIVRLFRGISPFTADKRHIHHALVRLGYTHRRAVYILTLIHIIMLAIAVVFRHLQEWMLFTVVLTIAILLCLWLDKVISKSILKDTD
jgi:UDP-GlcNAc:undecaprenyl-phosphate/decaprenyl-phosphate GlcNAc-1-phosphate transferase